ncbi:AMP-binding protein [Pectobacteriaceae bacterium CE70]|nr:AMP-binding protein [Pectobacteriaceae bacterium C52]WJV66946.1 AMP-binding protein [Pectobacteriaceae bacterium CE70]WJY10935.1 AMP-binding protein [Pectobacteriaceae bacterium C80]
MTLFAAIKHWATTSPERIALNNGEQQLTYRQLNEKINNLAQLLTQQGITRLALQLDNSIEWALVDLACLKAGIIIIPMPLFFSQEQQTWLLENSGADALIGAERSGWEATPIGRLPLYRYQPQQVPAVPAGTAKITYTSGTTGQPKGVCLSLRGMERTSQSLAERIDHLPLHRHLTLLPFATLLENITGLYVPLLLGAESVILPLHQVGFTGSSQFSIDVLAQVLSQWRPHSLVLVPELLRLLTSLAGKNRECVSSLCFVAVGGGKVAPDLLLLARQEGIPVYEGYGLSECGSVVSLNIPGDDQPGSTGRPLPHCEISFSAQHEIRVKGASMLGYLGGDTVPESIATGDLGRLDDAGFLHVDGRLKNVQINAFGRNFSPEWIETEAMLYSAISHLVVFGDGLPVNVALVHPVPGKEKDLSTQIDTLNEKLPDYARIHHFIVTNLSNSALMTSNGRLRRAAIYLRFQEQIQRAIQE